jgi:hypothetical protein
MERNWFFDKLEKLIWGCSNLHEGCEDCPIRAKCDREWADMSANFETQSFYYHIIKLSEILSSKGIYDKQIVI